MHKILQRQIKKYLGVDFVVTPELQIFFDAISKTYTDFDNDRALIEHSLELSSKELIRNIALLQATLDSSENGILVVSNEGRMQHFNQEFIKIWDISEDIIHTRSSSKAIEYVLKSIIEAEEFALEIEDLNKNPQLAKKGTVSTVNEKSIDWESKPQIVDRQTVGRVWSFLDVTKQKLAEQEVLDKISELQSLNELMLGRELKMVELKAKLQQFTGKIDTSDV